MWCAISKVITEMRTLAAAGLAAVITAVLGSDPVCEPGHDIPGFDYDSWSMATADPAECQVREQCFTAGHYDIIQTIMYIILMLLLLSMQEPPCFAGAVLFEGIDPRVPACSTGPYATAGSCCVSPKPTVVLALSLPRASRHRALVSLDRGRSSFATSPRAAPPSFITPGPTDACR